ncbi:hypothetical protein [Brucella tritici]|uniref:Uncharacterized protein n=1 Tax=Brucella tritici TaxID=94626 RepID=A0A6L3YWC8_9HYPH|nr:hypothetical protein [Brucella tritici]KAB2689650.1 hypothetical protein F9L08_03045 [Brucella tritici]
MIVIGAFEEYASGDVADNHPLKGVPGVVFARDVSTGIDWYLVQDALPEDYVFVVIWTETGRYAGSSVDASTFFPAGMTVLAYTKAEFDAFDVSGKVWSGSDWVSRPASIPKEISRRQFFQQLAVMEIISKEDAKSAMQTGTIPQPLQAIIDQLPTDDDKFNAEMLVIGADTFDRTHPLAETVRISLGWTDEQKADFWRDASKI